MEGRKQSKGVLSAKSFTLQSRDRGSRRHCCVPLCSASNRFNGVLSFHKFPKDPTLRAQWLAKIRRDRFIVKPDSAVCSRHFESGQIFTLPQGQRCLFKNSVPTLFQWNNYTAKKRPGVWERCSRTRGETTGDGGEEEEEAACAAADSVCPGHPDGISVDSEPGEEGFCVPMTEEHDYSASPFIVVDRRAYDNMVKEMEELRLEVQSLHLSKFGLERFSSSPEDIRHYTRFPSYEHLMGFWRLIEEATARIVRVTASHRDLSTSTCTETPVTRPTKLLPIDELFLFLTYLSTGFTHLELSHKFNVHRTTVSRIIVTWANFLYTLLGSISVWMPLAAVTVSCPKEFEGTYGRTQVIVDCTEMRCQTPSSLLTQSELFSNYKSACTFKALIGMSPHGALTFVSALYQGSISDKELFRHCGITALLTPDMDIMVDKGFLIDELVPGNVHRPAFLSKNAQMSEEDVLTTQSIARLRVHVERLIRRVKENQLFDKVIPLSISGSINALFTVACLLTNYQHAE